MTRLLAAALTLCCAVSFAAAPKPLECPAPKGTTVAAAPDRGDPKVREAAQRGLEFLVREATAWQTEHQCYGCHVHSVTLEALSVGVNHQYDIAPKAVDALLEGMLRLPGGSRSSDGLSYQHTQLLQPARAFGGAAFARYDAFVGSKVRDDLITVAGQLLKFQDPNGRLDVQYTNGPVARGDVQATYQAISTWKQAYARSADAKWLAPVQRAEAWLQIQTRAWKESGTALGAVSTSDLAYAVMGLSTAGVGATEAPMPWLTRQVLERQQKDGGFGDALTTGQALYALRLVGFTDKDKQVSLGTSYLVSHQQKGGGWGGAGFGKAEAMWGVLGLVSVDVMTVAIAKLNDGEHVLDQQPIDVEARDNKGDGVQKVELFIDDAKVAEACGTKLSHSWDTRTLGNGKHVVVAVATSFKGLKSQRQLEVFSGNTYLTQVGTEFDGRATQVTARDTSAVKHTVELNIRKVEAKDGATKKGDTVFTSSQAGASGPMKLEWDGKAKDGKAQPRGRYFAELVYRDEAGKELQREEVLFNHDTAEQEEAKFGQVFGKLDLQGGARGAAAAQNAEVDLVDEKGEVVQRTVTTEQGNYRFKNLDSGKYKVRVRKQGYDFADMPVSAAPAQAHEASGALISK
jgi:squalene-hopene/tetraprenyl-beta-curcumene cyclase